MSPMGHRRKLAARSAEAEKAPEAAPAEQSPVVGETNRSFVGRYGPVLAAANFNVWPNALLLEANDGVPHWRRIGLDRNELFFLLIALSHYFARESWPAVSIERLARWLDLTERRVQQIKNTLIEDRYLVRVQRQDRDGNRRPDGLDFTPLFALLEACLFRYHPDLITRDVAPAWLPPGPTAHPLDPDEFGRLRQEQIRRRQNGGRHSKTALPDDASESAHPLGAISFTQGVQSVSPPPANSIAPVGSSQLHHAGATGCAGSDPQQISTRGATAPEIANGQQKHRAAAPPGASPSGETEPAIRPQKILPLNDRICAIVEHHARTFRDDSPERSIETAHHLWWNSHIPLGTFVDLLDRAALVTKQTISSGRLRRGEPGARDAMPYFLRVLKTLCDEAGGRSVNPV
jgi:hypothetical protein